MKFLDELDVRHVDGETWRLLKELRCIPDRGAQITVPATFECDFASVPRGLWNIFPPTGKWGKAAWLHDWLYHQRLYPRKHCDDLFLEGMVALGVSGWRRTLMYRAVRAFGRKVYEDD